MSRIVLSEKPKTLATMRSKLQPWFNRKLTNGPWQKDKTWLNMATLEQCPGSDEVFRAIRKSKNNMDQIDKTNINDRSSSYVKIYFQLTSFLKDSLLCRIWDFCHAKSCSTLRNGYCGGMILLKNRCTFPRYLLLCWILNISWCFHPPKRFRVPFLPMKSLYLR